ncbi:MAG: hypothetical protein OEZ68_17510 [Gammaproteobacteria bacterium]|nr:hypothetical protein [Gammaproteobacteria bacterium]MDH5802602.1 hypothetical protein [Gammaproteobacteria bacterium]
MAQILYNRRRQQTGYILLLASIFLLILGVAASQLFSRSSDSTQISGSVRDQDKALLMAESALEHLRIRFVTNRLDTDVSVRSNDCIDANGTTQDACEGALLQKNMNTPDAFLFSYMFYVSKTGGLDVNQPSLLQKLADGEASNAPVTPLTTQKIPASRQRLRIPDMFGTAFHPVLYTLNENGRVVSSTAKNWDGETSGNRAAVWLEITQNPHDADSVDLFVQTVAQVERAKRFLQRYVGTYQSSQRLGFVSALSEASNIARNP